MTIFAADHIPNPTLAQLNAALGFNKLAQCRDGLFVANVNDTYIGRSLLEYGEHNAREASTLNQVVAPHDIVLEIGANIGPFTVGIAKKVGPQGRVLAFEPQPVVFQNLCANISLNSLTNVECYQMAVGAVPGTICVPSIRYEVEGNFGALALGGFTEGTQVPIVRIDDVFKYNRLKLMKIDVEGMESEVIAGAVEVIERFKPVLYVENDRLDNSESLIRQIRGLGYRLWWDMPHIYNPANFNANPNNLYANTVAINMLCVHRSVPIGIDHPEISDDSEHPLRSVARTIPPPQG